MKQSFIGRGWSIRLDLKRRPLPWQDGLPGQQRCRGAVVQSNLVNIKLISRRGVLDFMACSHVNNSPTAPYFKDVHVLDAYNVELILYKSWRPEGLFKFEIIINVFIWIPVVMVYGHWNILILLVRDRLYASESDVYRRQILTYKDSSVLEDS